VVPPPFEAKLVDKPGAGKVIVGRGAVTRKAGGRSSPRCTRSGAGRKLPVNLVLVAEAGGDRLPHFPQVVRKQK